MSQKALDMLEAEGIHCMREAAAQFERPVMLYSIGKDSSVLLHLAKKAFAPAKIPFPLLHVDTGFKFREMISFRDRIADQFNVELRVEKNTEEEALQLTAMEAATDRYIYIKKTKPLLEALQRDGYDCAFGGARRDEEQARAKERIFSVREDGSSWNPKAQRPELWNIYNGKLLPGQSMRVFPLSNWTELDIWEYIRRERIDIVPLYYAQKRQVVYRGGMMLRVDEYVQPEPSEQVDMVWCRYRTLGCSPSTGAVPSEAINLDEIIEEIINSDASERSGRAIDRGSESAMEKKKREGYF